MKLSVVDEFHCYEIKEEKELNVIITILAFLLMLNVIVIIHEAGHFLQRVLLEFIVMNSPLEWVLQFIRNRGKIRSSPYVLFQLAVMS